MIAAAIDARLYPAALAVVEPIARLAQCAQRLPPKRWTAPVQAGIKGLHIASHKRCASRARAFLSVLDGPQHNERTRPPRRRWLAHAPSRAASNPNALLPPAAAACAAGESVRKRIGRPSGPCRYQSAMTDLIRRVCKCSPIVRITQVLAAIYSGTHSHAIAIVTDVSREDETLSIAGFEYPVQLECNLHPLLPAFLISRDRPAGPNDRVGVLPGSDRDSDAASVRARSSRPIGSSVDRNGFPEADARECRDRVELGPLELRDR